ncbi:hypothetical protein HDU77_009035, partial [Chytriomyces hyalinus]
MYFGFGFAESVGQQQQASDAPADASLEFTQPRIRSDAKLFAKALSSRPNNKMMLVHRFRKLLNVAFYSGQPWKCAPSFVMYTWNFELIA